VFQEWWLPGEGHGMAGTAEPLIAAVSGVMLIDLY
jgi:hypothetical protein